MTESQPEALKHQHQDELEEIRKLLTEAGDRLAIDSRLERIREVAVNAGYMSPDTPLGEVLKELGKTILPPTRKDESKS